MTEDIAPEHFPLGRSLREHMDTFMGTLDGFIDDFDPRTRTALETVKDQLERLLRFVDSECAFYGICPADVRPGAWQARVFAIETPCGTRGVQLWIGIGDAMITAPIFELDRAEGLAAGICAAVEHGRKP